MRTRFVFIASAAAIVAVSLQVAEAHRQDQVAGPSLPPWEPITDQAAAATLFGFRVLGARGAMEDPPLDRYGLPMDFGDHLGSNVSAAGDFNGDGVDDLAIAAQGVMPDGRVRCGAIYVIHGRRSEPFPLELDLAEGFDGRVYAGLAEYDGLGCDLAVADFNGDGVDDLIVGAVGLSHGGGAYVIFGGHEAVSLDDLDGTNGVRIDAWLPGSEMGAVVAAVGDVNHDGVDDIALASRWSSPRKRVGEVVVLFGHGEGQGPFPPIIELGMLHGERGFRVVGTDGGDAVGSAVAGGHDVNGDGIADLVIGAVGMGVGAGAQEDGDTGAAAIIFGRDVAASGPFPGMVWLDRLEEGAGVLVVGARHDAPLGSAVAIPGDMDGDGLAEVVLGAEGDWMRLRDRRDLRRMIEDRPTGEAYILSGRHDWPRVIDLGMAPAEGAEGAMGVTRLTQTNPEAIESLGDLSGDGLADVGVVMAGGGRDTGVALVLGRPGPLPGAIDPRNPEPGLGVWLTGDYRGAKASSVARAGDINGDGLVDLVLGEDSASVKGREGAGRAMVLFGRPFAVPAAQDRAP